MTQPGDYAGKIAPHDPTLSDAQRADLDGDGAIAPNPLGGDDDVRDRDNDGLLDGDRERTTDGSLPPSELDEDGRSISSPRPEENPDIISLEEQNVAAGTGVAGAGVAGAGVAGAGAAGAARQGEQGSCNCPADCGCDHGAGVCTCEEGPAACTCDHGSASERSLDHGQTHRRDVETEGATPLAAATPVSSADDGVYAPNGGYGTEAAPVDRTDDLDAQTTGALDDGRVNEGPGLTGGTGFGPAHSDDVR